MNASEFRAWFEGFCEGVGDAPTAEQWAKVKSRISSLRDYTAPASRQNPWTLGLTASQLGVPQTHTNSRYSMCSSCPAGGQCKYCKSNDIRQALQKEAV